MMRQNLGKVNTLKKKRGTSCSTFSMAERRCGKTIKLLPRSYHHNHDKQHRCYSTEESNWMGRLINHSKSKPNLTVRLVSSETRPYICIFASENIPVGNELLYDYGDHSSSSVKVFKWLKN